MAIINSIALKLRAFFGDRSRPRKPAHPSRHAFRESHRRNLKERPRHHPPHDSSFHDCILFVHIIDKNEKEPTCPRPPPRTSRPIPNSRHAVSRSPGGTDTIGDRRMTPTLELVLGDITHETTDAIVNPVGPGLVDLAIRRVAGPELLEAFHLRTDELPAGKLLPGQAIATPGFGLPAAHVIHCRPSVFDDDPARARQDLVACHVESLRLARARGGRRSRFPAVGTGVYRYPASEAADDRHRHDRSRASPPRRPEPRAIRAGDPRAAAAVPRGRAAATDGDFWLVERGAVFSGLHRHR